MPGAGLGLALAMLKERDTTACLGNCATLQGSPAAAVASKVVTTYANG